MNAYAIAQIFSGGRHFAPMLVAQMPLIGRHWISWAMSQATSMAAWRTMVDQSTAFHVRFCVICRSKHATEIRAKEDAQSDTTKTMKVVIPIISVSSAERQEAGCPKP